MQARQRVTQALALRCCRPTRAKARRRFAQIAAGPVAMVSARTEARQPAARLVVWGRTAPTVVHALRARTSAQRHTTDCVRMGIGAPWLAGVHSERTVATVETAAPARTSASTPEMANATMVGPRQILPCAPWERIARTAATVAHYFAKLTETRSRAKVQEDLVRQFQPSRPSQVSTISASVPSSARRRSPSATSAHKGEPFFVAKP